jgi:hypothetical protein
MVGVGVGFCVGVGEGVGVSVGVFWIATFPVVAVGVGVVAMVELPYAEAAQIQRSSAAMSVPHPIPNFALRDRVRNQFLIPDGFFGGKVYGGDGGYCDGCWYCCC